MQWGWPCLVVLLAIARGCLGCELVNGSIITTIRVFIERWGPSRKLYQPTMEDKDRMKNLFMSQVGASMMNTMQDKLERYTFLGMGRPRPVELPCPDNPKITKCRVSYLNGLSFFNQENNFEFKDHGAFVTSDFILIFPTIMSESYIQYTTGGIYHHDIRGIYYFQAREPQVVRIEVMLRRKWYLWFIPSYCFVYITKIDYDQVRGEVTSSMERRTIRHLTRGYHTMKRHPEMQTIMNDHLRAVIPPIVIKNIDDILDDYRRNNYVCKYG